MRQGVREKRNKAFEWISRTLHPGTGFLPRASLADVVGGSAIALA